jgi:two-component system nitrate/nitrite response regulator NarL
MGKIETNPVRILVVCDLSITTLGLRWLLANEWVNLVLANFARDPAEAARLLAKEPAEVILLDLDGDNGVAAIAQLLAVSKARTLVLSASRDLELLDAVILAGACGVVSKREPVEVLLKAIEKVHAGDYWVDRPSIVRLLMAVARQNSAPHPEQEKIALLTRKERLTVANIARDAAADSREIARRLHISEHTLRNHLSSIYTKLGLGGRMELYAYARKHGLNGRAGDDA